MARVLKRRRDIKFDIIEFLISIKDNDLNLIKQSNLWIYYKLDFIFCLLVFCELIVNAIPFPGHWLHDEINDKLLQNKIEKSSLNHEFFKTVAVKHLVHELSFDETVTLFNLLMKEYYNFDVIFSVFENINKSYYEMIPITNIYNDEENFSTLLHDITGYPQFDPRLIIEIFKNLPIEKLTIGLFTKNFNGEIPIINVINNFWYRKNLYKLKVANIQLLEYIIKNVKHEDLGNVISKNFSVNNCLLILYECRRFDLIKKFGFTNKLLSRKNPFFFGCKSTNIYGCKSTNIYEYECHSFLSEIIQYRDLNDIEILFGIFNKEDKIFFKFKRAIVIGLNNHLEKKTDDIIQWSYGASIKRNDNKPILDVNFCNLPIPEFIIKVLDLFDKYQLTFENEDGIRLSFDCKDKFYINLLKLGIASFIEEEFIDRICSKIRKVTFEHESFYNLLSLSIYLSNFECVCYFLDKKQFDINKIVYREIGYLRSDGPYGTICISSAILSGNIEMLKFVIYKGAKIYPETGHIFYNYSNFNYDKKKVTNLLNYFHKNYGELRLGNLWRRKKSYIPDEVTIAIKKFSRYNYIYSKILNINESPNKYLLSQYDLLLQWNEEFFEMVDSDIINFSQIISIYNKSVLSRMLDLLHQKRKTATCGSWEKSVEKIHNKWKLFLLKASVQFATIVDISKYLNIKLKGLSSGCSIIDKSNNNKIIPSNIDTSKLENYKLEFKVCSPVDIILEYVGYDIDFQ